jgi:hypothetical protein
MEICATSASAGGAAGAASGTSGAQPWYHSAGIVRRVAYSVPGSSHRSARAGGQPRPLPGAPKPRSVGTRARAPALGTRGGAGPQGSRLAATGVGGARTRQELGRLVPVVLRVVHGVVGHPHDRAGRDGQPAAGQGQVALGVDAQLA